MIDLSRLPNPLAELRRLVRDRARLGLLALWLGLLFPLVVDTVRTREQVLAANLSGLELARGALPVVCFVLAVLLARPRVRPVTRTELAVGLFVFVAVASTTWSVLRWATLLKAGSLAVAYLTVMAIARLDERRGQRSLDSMAAIVFLIVVSALVQLAIAPGAVMIPVDGPGAANRLQGALPAIPADFLGWFATAGILFLVAGVGPALTRDRWIRIALGGACLLVLALTRARAATLLLLLGLLLLFGRPLLDRAAAAPRDVHRRWLVVAAAAAVAVVVVVGVEHSFFVSLVTRGQDPSKLLSLQGRTVTWGDALAQWVHRPIQGYGYYAGHRFAIPVRIGWTNLQNLDSMWVETLMDLGVLGLLALVLVVGSAAADLLRPAARDPQLAVRRTLFVLGVLVSFINPSLQAYTYPMVLLAVVCLGAPRLQLRS
jgi:O-antigen ligase